MLSFNAGKHILGSLSIALSLQYFLIYSTIASNCVRLLLSFLAAFFSYTSFLLPLVSISEITYDFSLDALAFSNAPLKPDCNNSNISLLPTCKYALPGSFISAANGDFKTSLLSSLFCTFKQSLNFEFDHICSFTCPDGFCVAKIKCTPKLRPILAALINSFINSGCSAFNSANSSTIIIKCGNGSFTSLFL